MRVSLLALGFTTTVAQVLLVRELVAVFYGNETDGRRFVQTARRTFDVVILDLPEPSTGAW